MTTTTLRLPPRIARLPQLRQIVRGGLAARGSVGAGLATKAGVAAAADWWAVAGQTCVAAYQPKGAASLAASYVNLANPGTYDATPGVAPTLDASGWVLDGTKYLDSAMPSNQSPLTFICRFTVSNVTTYRTLIGGNGQGFELTINRAPDAGKLALVKTAVAILAQSSVAVPISTDCTAGVLYNSSTGAYEFYIDGISRGSGTVTTTFEAGKTHHIGGTYVINAYNQPFIGVISAIAKYPAYLSGAQFSAVSAAMAAL